LSCHHALKEIKYTWKGITWIINVDIKKCFDRINHDLLLSKLSVFVDQPTVELVRKLLKAGYVDIHGLPDRTVVAGEGTPQGSLISPILCNLFLNDLDSFVLDQLYPKYNKGENRPKNSDYSKRYTLTEGEKEVVKNNPSVKKALLRAKHNELVKKGKFAATDGSDPHYRRLHYVRYADDFIIGFIGPKSEAEEVFDIIKGKLKEINLDSNDEKSKIYHSSDLGIKYLGMYLRYFSQNKVKSRDENLDTDDVTRQTTSFTSQAVNTVHLRVPVDRIVKRLVDKGFCKADGMKGIARATSFSKLCMLEDGKIVQRFNAIIRGIVNYYSCVNHRSDLWKILSLLRKSCALTLAQKHKFNSAARAYAQYGPQLKIKDKMGIEITRIIYPTSLKTDITFNIREGSSPKYVDVIGTEADKVQGSSKTNIKTADTCEYDDCEETQHLEAHHLNPVRNLNKRKDLSSFEKALIQRKRKVVMLCKKHHNAIHRKGLLDKGNNKAEQKNSNVEPTEAREGIKASPKKQVAVKVTLGKRRK